MTLDREARTIGWVVRAGTTRGYGWYLCDGALESVDGMVWGPKSSSYVYKTQREALADADERVEETRLVRVLRKPPSDTAPTIAALTAERDEARVRTTVVEARVRVVEFERDAAQREADAWQSKCKETEKGRDEWPSVAEAARRWEMPLTANQIRERGWTVAVHNDYRLNGKSHSFWMFTRGSLCAKGEGRTDHDAFSQVARTIDEIEAEASALFRAMGAGAGK